MSQVGKGERNMDFFEIIETVNRNNVVEIYPDFKVKRVTDIMVREKDFYAIWDYTENIWSTNLFDVAKLIDIELKEYADKNNNGLPQHVKYAGDFGSGIWATFLKYVGALPDNSIQLDKKITYKSTKIKKKDYVSKRVDYDLEKGPAVAYHKITQTLYDPEELDKLEWAIGAVLCGEAKYIHKFIVLYGKFGTGKSTIINTIIKIFDGYYCTFGAKELASGGNNFAAAMFKNDPLVGIQHDGDLSKVEDNTKLNSIVAHEMMLVNEKYKAAVTTKTDVFLFLGTNSPVKITDANSGIIRRLIDVKPSGRLLPPQEYDSLVEQLPFETGQIADHCIRKFKKMKRNYYSDYIPTDMMMLTDIFYNFVDSNYDLFLRDDSTTLKAGYALYKEYCEDSGLQYRMPRHKFRDELKNYFKKFEDIARVDGKQIRSYYSGFLTNSFRNHNSFKVPEYKTPTLDMEDNVECLLDEICKNYPAQYASSSGIPSKKWSDVKTTLKDIDTNRLHYVKVPETHIVIDFDMKDKEGNKSLNINLEAASHFPSTYSEVSKSGAGVHLHYNYTGGDPKLLSRVYDDEIEIKVFTGNSSLRRKLGKHNNIPMADISTGLPIRGDKKMINVTSLSNEKALRTIIKRNLNKEIHASTKSSVDFIHKALEDAYENKIVYDVTNLRPAITAFANNSTHQALNCLKIVGKMKFKSEEESVFVEEVNSDEIVFFDVEVFKNLFVVVWKVIGPDKKCVRMINPTPKEIESLINCKLVGFNNRKYDNHILYARMLGYTNEQLYVLSKRIINGNKNPKGNNGTFREAYGLSYADIYDFSILQQSLKKFQVDLGIHHQELGMSWDEPVEEKYWDLVASYCENDVTSTEAVFEARHEDFLVRQMLAKISGLRVNDSTNAHTTKIIFGNNKHPQSEFVYTDLSKMFPGYTYKFGKSEYKGINPSEGGWIRATPGVYTDVALLDVESLHPNSAILLNIFGDRYTKRYEEILNCRTDIKHNCLDDAKKRLNGEIAPFLSGEMNTKTVSTALKRAINAVYGMSCAKSYDPPFKDKRNVDNIIAKRGSLFMIDLTLEVEKRGYKIMHVKTDSIKIPNADRKIIDFVHSFGKKYGYKFDEEAVYERICLVNETTYIAYEKEGDDAGKWVATGTQFKLPYVYKKMFSKEPIELRDLTQVRNSKTAIYIKYENPENPEQPILHFVGKTGAFIPVKKGCGGGTLVVEKDGTYQNAVSRTKNYEWKELEQVIADRSSDGYVDEIDYGYYNDLVSKAIETISKYVNYDDFNDVTKPLPKEINAVDMINDDMFETSGTMVLPQDLPF